jgi:chaperonin cofactor prefoldin
MTKDEIVDEMEDYKARLEAEITALEKRISTLKEKE